MDAPLPTPDALIRPWRTATLVASLIAALELVLLVAAAFLLLAKPIAHAVRHHAEAAAFAPATKHSVAPAVVHHAAKVPAAKLSRRETRVFVFNGNGRNGAASAEAATLTHLGYRIPGTANAAHQNYATTVVMYRRGYEGEAHRLARDMHVQVVGPLDGVRTASLHGAQLAVVLGAE